MEEIDILKYLNTTGESFMATNCLVDAKKSFTQAVEKNHTFWPAHVNLAKIYIMEKENLRALMHIEQAILYNEFDINIFNIRGTILGKMRKYEDALDNFNAALAIDVLNVQVYLYRAAMFSAKRDYKNVIEDLKIALTIDPGNEEAKQELRKAEVYHSLKKDQEKRLEGSNKILNFYK